MVPNGTAYASFPDFANNGNKTPPGGRTDSAKYAQGMLPADTFPAEWANYLFHGATAGITRLNTDTLSIKEEINTVLSSRDENPDATKTNQLLTVLNKIKAEAILAAHPVGSLYWTASTENPAVTFGGGTWTQIKDKFILAAGDTYTNGDTGGAATVTLTTENLPSHSHSCSSANIDHTHNATTNTTGSHSHTRGSIEITGSFCTDTNTDAGPLVWGQSGAFGTYAVSYNYIFRYANSGTRTLTVGTDFYASRAWTGSTSSDGNHYHTFTSDGMNSNTNHTHTTDTKYGDSNGNATAHNNMPPYLVQYCWRRTA